LLCRPLGSMPGADMPSDLAAGAESSSGLMHGLIPGTPSVAAGSSAVPATSSPSSPSRVPAQPDPGTAGISGISTDTPAAPSTTEIAPPGSSAGELPVSNSHARPVTRLQTGIHKPKEYTDGTVRWGMIAATSGGSRFKNLWG
jgi:hypothetical protein